jgi:UDPglucose 6-dehydrogenase
MKIGVVGAGYVGLTVAACLAGLGHEVVCAEQDPTRRRTLEAGSCPLFEPGLDRLLRDHLADGLLRFVPAASGCARDAAVVILAVGTPTGPDGAADLDALEAAIDELMAELASGAVLVVKSTVPVGTADRVRARLVEGGRGDVDVVSNPEFLAEGTAVADFMRPARIVVGHGGERGRRILGELYAPLISNGCVMVHTDNRSAEMAKYAANAMLAARVSLMNELAALCDASGADIDHVRRVVAADARIGGSYLSPGCGFGGSCFPKDLLALEELGRRKGVPTALVTAVREVNTRQKQLLHDKLVSLLGPLAGRRVAVWGLAFKPGTDDVREAPALVLVRSLVEEGAIVAAHDPQAEEAFRASFDGPVRYAASPIDAARGADAVVICTEWPVFRASSLRELARAMRGRIMVDGRNLFEPEQARAAGFVYACIGRPMVRPEPPVT